jgi:hypothetical protein
MIEGIKTLKVLDGVSVDTPIEQKSTKKASNLFEDDDDDDLFNNNPLNNKTQVLNKPTVTPAKVTENKPNSSIKESRIEATNDPLSSGTQENAPIEKVPVKEQKIVEKPKQVETPVVAKEPKQVPKDEESKPVAKEEPKVVKEEPKPVIKQVQEEPKQEQAVKSVVEAKPAKVDAEKPKEEPKPAEKPKSTNKSTETSAKPQATPGVFKDSRTGLEISYGLILNLQKIISLTIYFSALN